MELCLKKSEKNGNNHSDDEESIDIEGESFEEYEWAGQKRIRTSTLLEGGYGAAGIGTPISNITEEDDDDEDLNVDGDDTYIYGPSQYSERNIVPLSGECEKEINENMYLRQLITGQDVIQQQENQKNAIIDDKLFNTDRRNEIDNNVNSDEKTFQNDTHKDTFYEENMLNGDGKVHQIVESLKAKIRDYESKIRNKCKCLICMDEFRKPAVSICCWHVHCEECWLRTLGARKLCPQCNMITSPNDLRRIYM